MTYAIALMCGPLQMLAPRFFGYIFALVVMFAVVFYLMFMSGGKKRKSRDV